MVTLRNEGRQRRLGTLTGLRQGWLRRPKGGLRTILAALVPKGLYARALLIIITPIVLLQSVVAFAFMEAHWQAVTRRLSESTARDVAALIEVYKDYEHDDKYVRLLDLARDRLDLSMQVLPSGDLPPALPKPFFALIDRTLSDEIRKQVKLPFWIDTVGQSRHVEIRVKLEDAVLRFVARRQQTDRQGKADPEGGSDNGYLDGLQKIADQQPPP